ncbi:predicted protein [Histoplasma mississippiense (nom. inval.)]|uniref:predicted protein n=1 Tax=Ajellomyces capsulatus (strain NAm1 / WU24) TaxID=2059318 RepID=UPI000157C7F8|nr:predicted protein [Histoplasma mississippiense (nom. inval.)]EDN09817.1 predicted protein [Histoplasma mississippiense (nom. inval.)]
MFKTFTKLSKMRLWRPAVAVDVNDNNLDPGQVPDLPSISQVEEMLIARVHVFVEIRQVRGQQYKYKGHVVNFLQDTDRIYNSLPLLPKDLDIIVLRPSNTSADPRLSHQFRRDFTVRKAVVKQWLAFLRVNHPGYANIDINQEALEALPVNEDVTDQLMIEDIEDAQLDKEINSDDINNSPECAAVPDLLACNEEVEQLRQEFEQAQNPEPDLQLQPQLQQPQILRHELTMPSFCNTSLDEFNNTHPLLSWAFPSLFPYGKAQFTLPRQRSIQLEFVVGFETTPESEAVLNSITHFSFNLRGTRPFWAMKRQQLQEYVKNLQSPHLFLTLSTADYHWDDLMRLLPNYENWKNGTSSERIKIFRENICDNPAIVAHWFHLRFTIFKREVLTKKFDIVDEWDRYEWQGRGSTHCHGVYWINGSINSEVGRLDETARQAFADHWGIHISAQNPEPGRHLRPEDECSAIALASFNQQNTFGHLPSVLNRVQRHHCSAKYCIRKERHQQRQSYTIQEEGLTRGLSYLQKYKQRPKELEDLTFFEFLQEYNHRPNRYNRRTRANYRILIYFPIYKPQSQAEDYGRVKPLLHHPFHEVDDLKTLDLPSSFDTFAEAFNYCKEAHVHSNDAYDNDISEPESEFEDVDVEKDELQNSFNELAALLPGDPRNITELNDLSFIGNRSIDFLSVALQNMAAENDIPSPILHTASTGVAAHTISGRTLHSIFHLPIKQTSRYEEFNPQTLQAMQAGMRNIQYLIIDEKFMVDLYQLSWIDQTCKAIYSHNHHLSFDGLSVILSDDFYQLPSVLQKPLFHSGELQNPDEINGRNLYYKFNQTIQLTVIRRQEGNDQESNQFRMVLDSLREENVRTQFPITIAYAITVHKSQGLSLDKAVLNIMKKDFTSGLTYVAVSRLLAFPAAITFDLPIHSSPPSFSQPPQPSQASTASQSVQESDDDPYTANI